MLSEFVVPNDGAETWKQAACNNIGILCEKTSSLEEEEYTEMIAHEGWRSIFLRSLKQFVGRHGNIRKTAYAAEGKAEQTNTTLN